MKTLATLLAEVRALHAKVDAALARQATSEGAMRRRDAAKAMGLSLTKLEGLIRSGKVKTAVDVHLIPLSEVRRYCAPKTPRRAPKRYDRVPEARDEAALVRTALRGAK